MTPADELVLMHLKQYLVQIALRGGCKEFIFVRIFAKYAALRTT